MNITKTIIIMSSGIIAFAICLTIAQFIFKKEKTKSELDDKIKLAYGFLYSSWIIGFSLLNIKILFNINELMDIVYKLNMNDSAFEITKTISVFIGLANIWLILIFFISKALSIMFFGKKNDEKEIENNNHVYFILKGSLFIGLICSFMPIFEALLKIFLPVINLPFYR